MASLIILEWTHQGLNVFVGMQFVVHMQCKVLYVGNYPTLVLPLSHKRLVFLECKTSLIVLMTCTSLCHCVTCHSALGFERASSLGKISRNIKKVLHHVCGATTPPQDSCLLVVFFPIEEPMAFLANDQPFFRFMC